MTDMTFPASRRAGLGRLAAFVPKAGRSYANGRNTDAGPDHAGAVSRLSPYVRRRLITEQEIITSVLACHGLNGAEKFVQEVLWRTYWKGWLEMRPAVWTRFLAECDRQRDTFSDTGAIASAINGQTGIEGFDDWARELIDTGYLHNHARMWFASIWIFTLRLPWALGADHFLRHLIDADAASNTLSWRWVAGLQTPGKTYLATADNIARYTNGRFAPSGLAREAKALSEPPLDPPRGLPELAHPDTGQASLLLVTDEDMHPESIFANNVSFNAVLVAADPGLQWGDHARCFARTAAVDTVARTQLHFDCQAQLTDKLDAGALSAAARAARVKQVVTPYAPVGPVADSLRRMAHELAKEEITLVQVRRDWDGQFWPYASKGCFAFKERIPAVLRASGLT